MLTMLTVFLFILYMYLDVSWILVRFICCSLQFLTDPSLDLIHVSAELLQGLGLTKLRALIDHLGLQTAPPFEKQMA